MGTTQKRIKEMTQLTRKIRKIVPRLSGLLGLLAFALLMVSPASAATSSQDISCGIYNSIFPEVNAGIAVASVLVFSISIIVAIINQFTSALNLGRGVMATIVGVSFLLLVYANRVLILDTIASYGSGTFNVAAIIGGC